MHYQMIFQIVICNTHRMKIYNGWVARQLQGLRGPRRWEMFGLKGAPTTAVPRLRF